MRDCLCLQVDCTWVGARCLEGYEPMVGFEADELRLGCGVVTPTNVMNTTLKDVEALTLTLTPLGCMEIAPEPEPEDIESGIVYCDPQPFKPSTVPVVISCPSGENIPVLHQHACRD